MKCERCGDLLSGNQERWCSSRCSKLGLKALYKKRKREQINAYNRIKNRQGIRGNPSTNNLLRDHLLRNPACYKCNSIDDVQVAHVKPRNKGGKNRDNLITLCRKHHYEFDKRMRVFWNK